MCFLYHPASSDYISATDNKQPPNTARAVSTALADLLQPMSQLSRSHSPQSTQPSGFSHSIWNSFANAWQKPGGKYDTNWKQMFKCCKIKPIEGKQLGQPLVEHSQCANECFDECRTNKQTNNQTDQQKDGANDGKRIDKLTDGRHRTLTNGLMLIIPYSRITLDYCTPFCNNTNKALGVGRPPTADFVDKACPVRVCII